MDKEKQKQLIIEVMHNDEKDGLYDHIGDTNKMVTAVEWLIEHFPQIDYTDPYNKSILQQAKQMEKERRKEDFKIGYNQGYLDAQCNHINDVDNLAYERDYLQSQIDDIDAQIKDKENKIADMLINGKIEEDKTFKKKSQ